MDERGNDRYQLYSLSVFHSRPSVAKKLSQIARIEQRLESRSLGLAFHQRESVALCSLPKYVLAPIAF
jgi:hypothetical protein